MTQTPPSPNPRPTPHPGINNSPNCAQHEDAVRPFCGEAAAGGGEHSRPITAQRFAPRAQVSLRGDLKEQGGTAQASDPYQRGYLYTLQHGKNFGNTRLRCLNPQQRPEEEQGFAGSSFGLDLFFFLLLCSSCLEEDKSEPFTAALTLKLGGGNKGKKGLRLRTKR